MFQPHIRLSILQRQRGNRLRQRLDQLKARLRNQERHPLFQFRIVDGILQRIAPPGGSQIHSQLQIEQQLLPAFPLRRIDADQGVDPQIIDEDPIHNSPAC